MEETEIKVEPVAVEQESSIAEVCSQVAVKKEACTVLNFTNKIEVKDEIVKCAGGFEEVNIKVEPIAEFTNELAEYSPHVKYEWGIEDQYVGLDPIRVTKSAFSESHSTAKREACTILNFTNNHEGSKAAIKYEVGTEELIKPITEFASEFQICSEDIKGSDDRNFPSTRVEGKYALSKTHSQAKGEACTILNFTNKIASSSAAIKYVGGTKNVVLEPLTNEFQIYNENVKTYERRKPIELVKKSALSKAHSQVKREGCTILNFTNKVGISVSPVKCKSSIEELNVTREPVTEFTSHSETSDADIQCSNHQNFQLQPSKVQEESALYKIRSQQRKYEDGIEYLDVKLEPLTVEETGEQDEIVVTLQPTVNARTVTSRSSMSKPALTTVPKRPMKGFMQTNPMVCKPFKCNICGYRTAYNKYLWKHMKIHIAEKPFKCEICEYKSIRKEHLQRHMKVHTGEKPFKCDYCEYRTAQRAHLQQHMITHATEKPFKCEICPYRTSVSGRLQLHMQMHAGERPFKCKLCDYKAVRSGHLYQHMKIHTGRKCFECEICEFRTLQNSSLKQHMKIHTGEKPFKCTICGYRTIQSSTLKQHMKTHTGEKSYGCHFCNYKTAHRKCLTEHIKTHTGEKPFECNICKYKTAQSGNLRQHMKTHSSEKPFDCGVCEFKSAYKKTVEQHRRIHTGEKPFQCTVCEHRTAHKSLLKRHMTVHTGEKPFDCKLCGFKTARKTNLGLHMKTHTG